MTFDFRSVPRCGKLAVTFFPGLVEPSLRHFLEEQGITGWSIISKRDALARFPDTKVPEDIRLYPGSPRMETQVRCLVSCYDPAAMYAEILKVNDSPENRSYLTELSEQYFKEEECAMENQHPDPAPAQPYPWYDDRVEAVRKEYVNPWEEDEPAERVPFMNDPTRYTPKEIYKYDLWKHRMNRQVRFGSSLSPTWTPPRRPWPSPSGSAPEWTCSTWPGSQARPSWSWRRSWAPVA